MLKTLLGVDCILYSRCIKLKCRSCYTFLEPFQPTTVNELYLSSYIDVALLSMHASASFRFEADPSLVLQILLTTISKDFAFAQRLVWKIT